MAGRLGLGQRGRRVTRHLDWNIRDGGGPSHRARAAGAEGRNASDIRRPDWTIQGRRSSRSPGPVEPKKRGEGGQRGGAKERGEAAGEDRKHW